MRWFGQEDTRINTQPWPKDELRRLTELCHAEPVSATAIITTTITTTHHHHHHFHSAIYVQVHSIHSSPSTARVAGCHEMYQCPFRLPSTKFVLRVVCVCCMYCVFAACCGICVLLLVLQRRSKEHGDADEYARL